MHGMLLDSRHADEHCDLRGGEARHARRRKCARRPVRRSTVSDTEASSIARRPVRFGCFVSAQGRNRTTDTGIFSPFETVEKRELPSADVRQAPFKNRQGRYAEARSCTATFAELFITFASGRSHFCAAGCAQLRFRVARMTAESMALRCL